MNLLNVTAGRLSRAVCLGVIVAAGGCASTEPKLPTIAKWGTAEEYPEETEQPEKLVALWSDDVLHQTGGPPTRGLGGRVYFYNQTEAAVPVDGQLVVYGFEDSPEGDEAAEENAPVKKFVFTKDQLVKHYSPSEFGPSYSFWLPWDSDMDEQKWISVVPVFIDSRGKVVMGQHARHRLNGKNDPALAKKEKQKQKGDEQVQLASHETSEELSSTDEETTAPRRLEATSIPLRGVTPAMIDSLRKSMQDSQVQPAGGAAANTQPSAVRTAVGRTGRDDTRKSGEPEARGSEAQDERSDDSQQAQNEQVRNLAAPSAITTARQLTRPRIEPDQSDWRNQMRRSAPTSQAPEPISAAVTGMPAAAVLPNGGPLNPPGAVAAGPVPSNVPSQMLGQLHSSVPGALSVNGPQPLPTPGTAPVTPGGTATEMVGGQPVTSQVYYGRPGSSLSSGPGKLAPAAYPTSAPGAGTPAPAAPTGSLLRLPTR